jgi:hypothetical protein
MRWQYAFTYFFVASGGIRPAPKVGEKIIARIGIKGFFEIDFFGENPYDGSYISRGNSNESRRWASFSSLLRSEK